MSINTTTTRRRLLAAAPIAAISVALPTSALATVSADNPDAALEQAWDRRRAAMRVYNALPYGEDETGRMSAEEARMWGIVDESEEFIRATPARTPRGAEIQLWASLAHSITSRGDDDAINRADLAHFVAKDRDLDWNVRLTLAALRSLHAMGA